MEPPAKRQRLGLGPALAANEDDELDFDPEELNQMRDPAYQLEQARDKAVYKLKSRFEDIFAKYERDFTGVGDEIDLRSGKVVVDNGHLESMEFAKDDDEEDDQDSEQDEERIMNGPKATGPETSVAVTQRDPWAVAARPSPMLEGPPRLSSMMSPSRDSRMTPPQSFNSFDSAATLVADPAWQAPDLPASAFLGGSFGAPRRQYEFGMGRKFTRKALPAPQTSGEEDEDVLLGVSEVSLKQKQQQTVAGSPLIKERFPAVDSSPGNDSGLNDLIQEVMENLPETPPSVQKSMASKPGTEWQPLGSRTPSQPMLGLEEKVTGRKPGRPFGSKNSSKPMLAWKVKVPGRKAGRPPGSKNHPKPMLALSEETPGRTRGRSFGSKISPKPMLALNEEAPKRKAGRPFGSKNHAKAMLASGETPGRKSGRLRKEGLTEEKVAVSKDSDAATSPESTTGLIAAQRHKPSLGGQSWGSIQASEKKAALFQQGDLDLYQDVTGLPAVNSARPLYINIEARNIGANVSDTSKLQTLTHPRDTDMASTRTEAFNPEQATRIPTETGARKDADAPGPRRRKSIAVSGKELGSQGPKPSNTQGTFEMNVINPVFAFSDEENLPPKRTRRKSEPAKIAAPQVLQAPRSKLQQDPPAKDSFRRNVVDPSYAFSDEETALPRRTRGRQEPAASAKSSGEESSAGRRPQDGPAAEPKEAPDVIPRQRGRAPGRRSLRKPEAADGTTEGPASGDALPTGSDPQGTALSTVTDTPRLRSRIQRGTEPTPASASVHEKRAVGQAAEESQPGSCPTRPGTVKRRPGRPSRAEAAASPELGEPGPTAAGPASASAEVGDDEPGAGPSQTATSAPQEQPLTPQHKSKVADSGTPSSKPGLISLLSDNEDEEDEISFDLSAFTPSGHHRILAHRPNSSAAATTTPHTASNSTASRNKRASGVLFGPQSTSRVRKHRTPGSERRGGKAGRRRDSAGDLARSVVKVRRQSFRAPSPAGSVVQTPGGSKRRCGVDGFSCGRDFCFVCISI